jgi:hypothetical protein
MIRKRQWSYQKAIDHVAGPTLLMGGNPMVSIPTECQEFLRNNKQVVCRDERIRFMTLDSIRTEVIAGTADDWDVIDFDFDSGEATLVCVYCVTGVEHPDATSSGQPPIRTLH